MPALERMSATRVVATPAALDQTAWPAGLRVLRLAPDEVLVLGSLGPGLVADAHAIVERETGWCGLWRSRAASVACLERHCRWVWPTEPGRLAQGAIAGLPVKIWVEADRVLWLVPEAFGAEFEARLL